MDERQHTALKELEGRKRALLLGEHYTAEPLSRDHRDDILRWIHDLDVAIAALALVPPAAGKGE